MGEEETTFSRNDLLILFKDWSRCQELLVELEVTKVSTRFLQYARTSKGEKLERVNLLLFEFP